VSATITGHAYDIFEESDASLIETIHDAFDAVYTISNYNMSFLRNEYTVDDRLELVRMGVRPEKFEPTNSSEDAQFLTISRHIEKKGLEYAIEAIDQIVESHPSLEYRIVGEGPRSNRLKRLVELRGLQEYVTFLGTVDDDQLIRELDSCTAFVLPCIVAKSGDRDGIPVALMEAMAMETPVISTYVSGISELVTDGSTGFLVPSGQSEALAETMNIVLTEEDYRDRVGNAARETIVERFSSEVTGERLEALFREVSEET
jgi:glycosyltransferase involved in cell wall biosynthesis